MRPVLLNKYLMEEVTGAAQRCCSTGAPALQLRSPLTQDALGLGVQLCAEHQGPTRLHDPRLCCRYALQAAACATAVG